MYKHTEIITRGGIKPYYQIRYFDTSDGETHIGYGSYNLELVKKWKEELDEGII